MQHASLKRQAPCGFTLIEIAIALAVLMLLMAAGVAALRLQLRQAEISNTRTPLEDARTALIGFAEINHRLPCPDTNNDGLENLNAGPTDCTAYKGSLPYQTLALQTTEDGWSRPLLYAVKDLASPVANQIKLSTDGNVKIDAPTFSGAACASNGVATQVAPSSSIAFALWSSGEDRIDSSATAGNDPQIFVASTACPADDIVIWTSKYLLFGRMIEAGWVPPQ